MKILYLFLMYILLVVLWCIFYFQFLTPVKDAHVIVLLFSGSVYCSIVLWALILFFQRILGFKGKGILLIPAVTFLIVIYSMDKPTLIFMFGLVIICEAVLITKLALSKPQK